MPSAASALFTLAMLAMASAQGVILKAEGDSGKSLGLQVSANDTSDANFISLAELSANVVNECGRTLLKGNIDIGENTEAALVSGDVTKVTKGSTVNVVISKVNANGTGPYTCDMDETSNASGTTGQVPLTVKEDDSGGNQIKLAVTMPKTMACIGASVGNVCTVRCRNPQDYGGCFAVQQTDTTALPGDNAPSNITSAQTLEGIQAQIQQNQKDLPAAIAGNQQAATVDEQGVVIADVMLNKDPSIQQSVNKELASAVASSSSPSPTGAGRKRMTPAGRRVIRYPGAKYVVSGKDFDKEDN